MKFSAESGNPTIITGILLSIFFCWQNVAHSQETHSPKYSKNARSASVTPTRESDTIQSPRASQRTLIPAPRRVRSGSHRQTPKPIQQVSNQAPKSQPPLPAKSLEAQVKYAQHSAPIQRRPRDSVALPLPLVRQPLMRTSPSPVIPAAFSQPANPYNQPARISQESASANPKNTLDVDLSSRIGRPSSVKLTGDNVNVFAQGVDIRDVLGQLAEESEVDIVVSENVDGKITTTLTDIPLWEALDAILKINGLVWTQQGKIVFVTKPEGGTTTGTANAAGMPGLQLQVFDLHYTSAEEVLTVVNGLLSPAGKAFAHKADISSTRQTRERIVVEDYQDRIGAVSQYLANVDNPPRQVLIEAHVLQVTLDDDQRHGVNLLGVARLAGAQLNVQAQGFANAQSSPGFMMGLNGTDLDGMVEALQQSSLVETLAAPKVLCVNGQQARIQIGSKFGYFVTTTTQTSTLQNVDFLDIGVVLQVQPTITHDGQVLLTVEPKVSGGRINPDTGLPEEDTTEASTTVLLPDGKGMIIGGLIKETNDHKKWWVPVLGKTPVIGKLFSRSNDDVQRVEVIIALTTHVVPFGANVDARECEQFSRSTLSTAVENHYAGPWWQQDGQVVAPNRMQPTGRRPELVPHANVGPVQVRPQYLPPVRQPTSSYQLRD